MQRASDLGEEGRIYASGAFFKAHGLGNDYLVFEEVPAGEEKNRWPITRASVRAVCDRTRGVGSDGIILLRMGNTQPLTAIGFNPDGSTFERSGNGLRILGAFLVSRGRMSETPVSVRIGGDDVLLQLHSHDESGLFDLSVDMGRALFGPAAVGLDPEALNPDGALDYGEGLTPRLEFVSIGNPHSVVFSSDLDSDLFQVLGPGIGRHPAFSEGTNVQMAMVTPGGAVQVLIWERGVGPTMASGTSSCAAAAAAVLRGYLSPGEIKVQMEGGELRVEVREDHQIRLRGPVAGICEGELTRGFGQFLNSVSM